MSSWLINIFDRNDRLLKTKKVDADSKYHLKKVARSLVNKIDDGESYSYRKDEKDAS